MLLIMMTMKIINKRFLAIIRQTVFFALFAVGITIPGLSLSSEPVSGYAAMSNTQLTGKSKSYVNEHRDDLNAIYSYARSLQKKGQLAESLQVFEAALIYYPGNSALLGKRILAENDLRESRFIVAMENEKTQNINSSTAHALDEIKCKTLRGEEGIKACQRLQYANMQLSDPGMNTQNNQNVIQNEYYRSQQDKKSSQRSAVHGIDLGNFYALVIGNNRYPHFPKLKTAVQDAKVVSDLLENKYGFQVTQLKNAKRYKIFQELSRLRKTLTPEDNLLIYYAGHGYLDDNTKRGYWLPVDAETDNFANWLPTSDVTDMLHGMSAKHVMVVADSCYSGTLTRGIEVTTKQLEPDQFSWIKKVNNKKSRTVMTSGGLEPVLDSGNGDHSIFSEAFIQSLNENSGVLEASIMFTQVRRLVVLNADQTPEYSDIRKAGHQGGDFIFVRVN